LTAGATASKQVCIWYGSNNDVCFIRVVSSGLGEVTNEHLKVREMSIRCVDQSIGLEKLFMRFNCRQGKVLGLKVAITKFMK
jgi:hypothetical protein